MQVTPASFKNHFAAICDHLGALDPDLGEVTRLYGYPPLWSRQADFRALVHFILEQQVSLASAKAAMNKLEAAIDDISPARFLELTDEELRACYFSRQKAGYARALANSIVAGELNLGELQVMPDENVRTTLKKLKGIGDWTVDVFLMMSLHRCDLFPVGDVALVRSIKEVKSLSKNASREEILATAELWRPYRSVAAYILWHAYLQKRTKPLKEPLIL